MFVAAAAVALSLSALPAKAAVFADFTPDAGTADFKWVKTGNTSGDFFSIAIVSNVSAVGAATHFSFLDPTLSALVFLPATFTMSASVANSAAINNGGGAFTQPGVGGNFSFIYSGPTTTIGGVLLTQNVTNLLSGVFSGGTISGGGRSGAANLAVANGGVLSYTSDVETFTGMAPMTQEFAINLLNAEPKFQAAAGQALRSFNANGGGNFSFGVAPEPGAWALMILGFGGLGVALRSRRRTAVA
jgi:hypothetical protein